jgi:hypothetical protein
VGIPRVSDGFEDAARWLWTYLPGAGYGNPLSISSQSAEKIMARYAWDHPASPIGVWYRSLSEEDCAAFREYWYALSVALR